MSRHQTTALLFLGGVAACSSSPSASEPIETAASAQTTSLKGTYSVPVDDEALRAVASFPTTVKVKTLNDGSVRMHYTLPAELVGNAQSVDFEGPAGSTTLTGENGTAVCNGAPGTPGTQCNETFTGIHVDLAAVAHALDMRQVPAAERDLRLQVAEKFGIDPIGILHFPEGADKARSRDRDR